VSRSRETAANIRPAAGPDAALLADIIRRSFRDVAERFGLTMENCPSHSSYYTTDRARGDLRRGMEYYLAEWNGQAAGCAGIDTSIRESWHLERLAVLPEARRRGIGASLVRHVLRLAADNGAREVTIGIIAQNTELLRWYERLGFVTVETRWFAHLPFEVMFLKKKISP
jgi:ribosomal protein S18 acetylase RimI-like enzyme